MSQYITTVYTLLQENGGSNVMFDYSRQKYQAFVGAVQKSKVWLSNTFLSLKPFTFYSAIEREWKLIRLSL